VSQQSKTFRVVAGVHIGVVALLCCQGGISHLFKPKPEIVTPIDFVVDVTPLMPDVSDVFPDIPEPDPIPAPIADPAPIPEPQPVPEPVKKPKPPRRKKIEVSRKKVRRSDEPRKPKKPTLSEKEIQKLLAEGAKAGDYTSIPDEDSRCLALIKQTLHAAWEQPSSEAAGNGVAVLCVSFETDGRVRSGTLERSSGNAELDDSVRNVANGIQRIHGLTPDFIRRHATVTVSFKVD
jgi:TonB family protein